MLAARLFFAAFALLPSVDYATALDVSLSIEGSVARIEDDALRVEIADDEVRWSRCESLWRTAIVSPTDDLGVMQVNSANLTVPRAAVLSSRRVGFDQALRIILEGYEKCGSRDGAWSYYAGGRCNARKALVWRRLHGGMC